MPYKLFAEVTRNGAVESRHFGAAVVCDYQGNVLESWGDIKRLIFPRSALKPLMATDLILSGASDHYDLSEAELTMACASHQGESIHSELILKWLGRIGITQDYLACGADLPDDIETARQILISGKQGCKIHHNCSGKHAGFLTTALHLDMPLEGIHRLEHPLQQLSLDTLSDLSETNLRKNPMGIDGCGFPAPMMPLQSLGLAVARFANPGKLSTDRAASILKLHQAIAHEPLFAAGHGTVVTELNQVTKGRILAKTGAEGVLTAALPEQGLGIALKISDGSARARSTSLMAILDHLGLLSDAEKHQLKAHINPQVKNSRDLIVGEIRPATSWLSH